MNYYRILRLNSLVKSERLKILGVGLLFLLKKRFLNLFLDPVLVCNFRCMMCYFSDPDYKPSKERFTEEMMAKVANCFFSSAMRLQIGCGAEPTLYKHNEQIIKLAKQHGVPYVSFTTNGALLNYDKVEALAKAGLDEIILSMHGASKEVYERMMPGAKFEILHEVLRSISKVKEKYQGLKLRINYTVNPDNLEDLKGLVKYLDDYHIDVLQVRPIRRLGNSAYSDFDIKRKQKEYSAVVKLLADTCHQKGIVSIITGELPTETLYRKRLDIAKYTYCYVSPIHYGDKRFIPNDKPYRTFLKSNGFLQSIFKDVFFTRNYKYADSVSFANYDVNV